MVHRHRHSADDRGVLSWSRVKIGVELKFGFISALFVLLIAAGVLLTSSMLARTRADERAMNLAARERMLSQKIAKDAFAVVRGEDRRDELATNLTLFDQTLAALMEGDLKNGIRPVRDEQVRGRLEQALSDWKQFRPHVDVVVQANGHARALADLLRQNEELAAKLQAVARSFEQSKLDGKPHPVAVAAGLAAELQKLNKELVSQLGTASNLPTTPAETADLLDKTLSGLLAGNASLGLTASRDPQVRQALEAARKAWEPLRPQLGKLVETSTRLRFSLREISLRNERLLETMTDAVDFLEASGATHLQQLQTYQRLLLFLAFFLALVGVVVTRLLIVRPVAASAHRLALSSAQILTASQQLEEEAKDQVDALENVTQTVQSLTESATRISESAEGVRENAERSRQTTDLTVKRFEELSARTTRVAELLETIRHISERSDLLALNASLEGSRAGEAGRAFSLVAKEIRRLAEAVSASVVDVKKLVTDIRESGAATVQATDEARKLAQSTAEASAEISMTTQRQRNATLQLAESMQAISAVLSRSTISTRETRAAAQDLKRQAERLSAVVARVQG